MTQYVQAKIEKMEQPVAAWILISIMFVLVCAYAYFVNGAIANIVAAKDMQDEFVQLAGSVGNLERQFLTTKTGINMEYAYSRGLRESPAGPIYITKQPYLSLSFNR